MSAQANIHNAHSGNVSLSISIFCAPGEQPDAVAAVSSDAKDYRIALVALGGMSHMDQWLAARASLADMSDCLLFCHVTAI